MSGGTLDYREPKAQEADAWFHSINYLRPKAVRAAIQFLKWSMDNIGQTTFAFSSVPELAQYFQKHTDPASESCLSVRLIFGEKFPYLQAWDPIWANNAVDRIFPNAPELQVLRDVAWTAYAAPRVLDVLIPQPPHGTHPVDLRRRQKTTPQQTLAVQFQPPLTFLYVTLAPRYTLGSTGID